MKKFKSICVTGHRDIGESIAEHAKSELRREIMLAIEADYSEFISGFANGVDLLFASIVAEFKEAYPIKLEAAISYRNRIKSFNNEFQRLLAMCDMIGIISEQYSPQCFIKRNKYKVDDIAYRLSGGRSVIYPVIAGQIGVGCCHRVNKKVIPEKFKREIVLSLPDIADADGIPGFFTATAKKLNECSELKRIGLEFSTILPYKTAKNTDKKFEDRGTACIQDRMIEREKELVAELVREGKLNQDNYLVKDGSLEYKPTKEGKADKKKYQMFKNNYSWVLGVSKNFNPEVCLDINGKPNPGFIADLPLYYRTPVACFISDYLGDDIQFAVWYIRLRDKKDTRTPFDGILKVEKILVTQEDVDNGIESDLVDTLALI